MRAAVLDHLPQAASGGRVHMLWRANGLAGGSGEKQFSLPDAHMHALTGGACKLSAWPSPTAATTAS